MATATTIVEVRGGCAEITQGFGVVVDWDEIGDNIAAAELALEVLKGKRGRATEIREFIYEVWPELAPGYREED